MSETYTLSTDGGARGNPGPAGAAFVLEDPRGHVVRSGGRFLGETTNNVAEYRALLWGLATALDEGVTRLEVHSDSELIVRQIAGRYRVKNEMLLPLHREAMDLLSGFVSAEVIHVRREENRTADGLANRAMDLQGTFGDGVEIGLETQGTLFGEGEA